LLDIALTSMPIHNESCIFLLGTLGISQTSTLHQHF
jgi:hypothetical protein